MNTAAIKRLLILLSSTPKIEQARLYQLIQAAESCYCLKDTKGQYELGAILKMFPEPLSFIGDYYQAVHLYKQGHKKSALETLDAVRRFAPRKYQDKSLLTIGGLYEIEGNLDEAMKVRLAASKSETFSIVLDAALGMASLLGTQGKHANAVEYMEGILPLASKLGPVPLYFDLLNSYAVELSEQGKIDAAYKVIEPVVSSPYALYYPNWLETQQVISEKSRRSIVPIGSTYYNILSLPEREVSEQPELQPKPARILSFAKGKKKMAKKEQEKEIEKSIDEMTFKDLGFKLLELITTNQADEEQMRLIVTFVMQVFSEPVMPPDKPSA